MGHPISAVTGTVNPTILPTLLEPTTVSKSTSPTTMTKIVKMPQTVSNNLTQSDKITPKAPSPHTPAMVKNTPSLNSIEAITNPTEALLTERDLPTKNHTNIPSPMNQNQQQKELAARTAQLSEAINAVKRLNQQAIDKANVQ